MNDQETATYRAHRITTYRDRHRRWCANISNSRTTTYLTTFAEGRAEALAKAQEHVDEIVATWQQIRDDYERCIQAAELTT
jgi:hypothetical protein